MPKSTLKILQDLQAMPLIQKVILTKARIREWVEEYGEDGVYVSFSGGKDSTVLLHLVRSIYPNLQAVFCDTGLELPEIREFVRTFDNVEWLKPKKTFVKVIEDDGYPLIGKEVSECVQGARKYLKALIARENSVDLIDGCGDRDLIERINTVLKSPNEKIQRYCSWGGAVAL